MKAVLRFLRRTSHCLTRRSGDARLREEMEAHLERLAEEHVRAGMLPEQARREARLQFGATAVIQESYHAEHSLPWVENVLRDVQYAVRVLRKAPAFTLVAIVTLMMSIGANVVVFGVLNAVLFHPLPVADPQSLYQLRHQQWMIGRLLTTSYPAFEDLRRRTVTLSGLAAVSAYSRGTLRWGTAVTPANGDEATGNYFDLLGVQPQLGRFFTSLRSTA